MVEVSCYSGAKGTVGTASIDAKPLGDKLRRRLVRQAVIHYAAAHRAGTHSTLTRAEVNFNTRKPWRQKGTGRARSGDFSSPLWRKDANGLSRRARQEALRSTLLGKLRDDEIKLVDKLKFEKPSTKQAAKVLDALGARGVKTLVVLADPAGDSAVLMRSFRNLDGVRVEYAANVNAEHLLQFKLIVLEKDAFDRIVGRLGNA
jgi:large subunit ribosomal protein L4